MPRSYALGAGSADVDADVAADAALGARAAVGATAAILGKMNG